MARKERKVVVGRRRGQLANRAWGHRQVVDEWSLASETELCDLVEQARDDRRFADQQHVERKRVRRPCLIRGQTNQSKLTGRLDQPESDVAGRIRSAGVVPDQAM